MCYTASSVFEMKCFMNLKRNMPIRKALCGNKGPSGLVSQASAGDQVMLISIIAQKSPASLWPGKGGGNHFFGQGGGGTVV
jgi:hypothetical protein